MIRLSDSRITYTMEEMITITKLSRRTLYAYLKKGYLVGMKFGNDWRFTQKQIDDFYEKMEKK